MFTYRITYNVTSLPARQSRRITADSKAKALRLFGVLAPTATDIRAEDVSNPLDANGVPMTDAELAAYRAEIQTIGTPLKMPPAKEGSGFHCSNCDWSGEAEDTDGTCPECGEDV